MRISVCLRRWIAFLLLLGVAGCASHAQKFIDEKTDKEVKKVEAKGKNLDLGDIHAEILVLQVFHSLDLNAEQREAFGKLATKCAQKAPPRKEFDVSRKFRDALIDVRAALRENDPEKIEMAGTALEALREKESPDFDEIEVTDEARKAAPEFFKTLNARQIAFYLSGLGNAFPDPVEVLTQALEESQKLEGVDWQEHRDGVAFQIGWLIGGQDSAKDEKVRDAATALLDKAHGMKEKEFAQKKAELVKSAREMVGALTSLDVIRHYIERVLAESLSNYRASAAVEARGK